MDELSAFFLGAVLFLSGLVAFFFSFGISDKGNNLPSYASLAVMVIGGTIALVTILF